MDRELKASIERVEQNERDNRDLELLATLRAYPELAHEVGLFEAKAKHSRQWENTQSMVRDLHVENAVFWETLAQLLRGKP